MTITNGYCTFAQLKAVMYDANMQSSTADEAACEIVIEAVSRQIDNYCNRHFYTTTADETRTFQAANGDRVFVDDLVSITTIKADTDLDRVYETTLATTDYDMLPISADGRPYTYIQTAPLSSRWFTGQPAGVQIVGKFGWAAVPMPIVQACIIQSMRIWKRKDAPFGISGSGEMGQAVVIPTFDPDVKMLLDGYRRIV